MRKMPSKTLLMTLFMALVAAAMVPGSPAAGPVAATIQTAAPVRLATILCGGNGCGQVQTKRVQRRKFQTMGHG
jgi:hypothetical protein